MKRHNIISFLAGVLSAVLLCTVVVPVLAAYTKTIEVYPNSIKLFVDDVLLEPKDINGNPVDIFVYNGTTYVPIRAVSNALGKPVQYDGSVGEAYIGKHTGDKPAVWLTDLDWFDKSGSITTMNSQIDNLGQEHSHCLCDNIYTRFIGDFSITYHIDGNYTMLTGTLFQEYSNRASRGTVEFEIYGDEQLLWSGTMTAGIDPVEFSVDVRDVQKLKIHIFGRSVNGSGTGGSIGDLGLWT